MPAMPELVLYNYWRSSSSHRVRIALELKGLRYRYEAVNLRADEQSGEAHRSRSPTGFVPCLAIDGVLYVESVAIIELLEERFPGPRLLPEDPHARARVRALVEIVNSGIQPFQNLERPQVRVPRARGAASLGRSLHRPGPRGVRGGDEEGRGRGRPATQGPYAFGSTPTAADVFLVPQFAGALRFKVDTAPYPRVVRAFEAAMKLEAFQRAAPERQPDAVAT